MLSKPTNIVSKCGESGFCGNGVCFALLILLWLFGSKVWLSMVLVVFEVFCDFGLLFGMDKWGIESFVLHIYTHY
jgi:hypothetical protein